MRNRGYQLTMPMIELYYNVLGVDDNEIDYRNVELYVNMIEDISPIRLFNLTDMLSYQLDDNMVVLLERVSKLSSNKRKEYLDAVNIILKAVTNLNLINEDSEDYVLLYKRISYLLNIVLSELNTFSVESTIKLSMAIKNGSYSEIDEFTNFKPITSLLLLLSMNPNDICDYQMYRQYDFILGTYEFENKGINLKLGEVMRLLNQNKWEKSDLKFDETPFKRLSFKKSCDMTK